MRKLIHAALATTILGVGVFAVNATVVSAEDAETVETPVEVVEATPAPEEIPEEVVEEAAPEAARTFSVQTDDNGGGDAYNCPAGTDHEIKVDGLSGTTYTVPTPPAGWTISTVTLKVGGGGNGLDVHQVFSPVAPGQVLTVTGKHDISHAHICKNEITYVPPTYPPFNPAPCTEYRLEKWTSTYNNGKWSTWADWPDAGPLNWGVIPSPRTGHHQGTHGVNGDREFAYVVAPNGSRPIVNNTNCRTTVIATATYTPPTCTTAGSVVLGSNPGYTWTNNGVAEPTGKTYTAVAATNFVLSGQTVFGPYRIAKLTPLDTKTCRPQQPADKVVTVDSGDPTCGSITVATTTTTTPYVWDSVNGVWIEGVSASVDGTRPLTDNEKVKLEANCTKVDLITYGEWSGEFECGDTTVDETRSVTTISYSYDATTGLFVAGPPVPTSGERNRDLTADEKAVLAEECVVAADPGIQIDTECGYYDIELNNAITVPEGYTGESATFVVTIDGVETDHTVLAGEAKHIEGTLDEDSADVEISVRVKGGDGAPVTATVETDCELTAVIPKLTVVAASCAAEGSVTLGEAVGFRWVSNANGSFTAVPNTGFRIVGITTFGPFPAPSVPSGCSNELVPENTTPEPSVAALPPVQPAQTPVPPAGATTTVAPPSGTLPVTGSSSWIMLWIAIGALGAGYVAVRMSRRSAS